MKYRRLWRGTCTSSSSTHVLGRSNACQMTRISLLPCRLAPLPPKMPGFARPRYPSRPSSAGGLGSSVPLPASASCSIRSVLFRTTAAQPQHMNPAFRKARHFRWALLNVPALVLAASSFCSALCKLHSSASVPCGIAMASWSLAQINLLSAPTSCSIWSFLLRSTASQASSSSTCRNNLHETQAVRLGWCKQKGCFVLGSARWMFHSSLR